MNKRNTWIVLGVIVILILTAGCGTTQVAKIPTTTTPTLAPLPVPSGCAKQVIDLPVDESLEWRQGGGVFAACGITIKIEYDGMMYSTYASFKDGEFIKKQLNTMTKVVFTDGTEYYLYKPDRADYLMVAAVAAPPSLPVSTGCAVQVQSLDKDNSLAWIPSGESFSACDITLERVTGFNDWGYNFKNNGYTTVGNYMIKITFSDGVVIYAQWGSELLLAGKPAP